MRTGLDSDAHRSGLEARLCPRAPGGLGGVRGASPALRTPHPDGGADPPGLPLPAPPPGQGAQSPDVKASSTLTLALSLSTHPEERDGRSRHLHQCLAVAPWRYSFLPQTVGENSSASPILTAGCERLSARGEPPSPGWASPSLLQTRPSGPSLSSPREPADTGRSARSPSFPRCPGSSLGSPSRLGLGNPVCLFSHIPDTVSSPAQKSLRAWHAPCVCDRWHRPQSRRIHCTWAHRTPEIEV